MRCTVLIHRREGRTRPTWRLVRVNNPCLHRGGADEAHTALSAPGWCRRGLSDSPCRGQGYHGARPFVLGVDLRVISAFSVEKRPFMLMRLLVVPLREKKKGREAGADAGRQKSASRREGAGRQPSARWLLLWALARIRVPTPQIRRSVSSFAPLWPLANP